MPCNGAALDVKACERDGDADIESFDPVPQADGNEQKLARLDHQTLSLKFEPGQLGMPLTQ